jgi:hypothetical protein
LGAVETAAERATAATGSAGFALSRVPSWTYKVIAATQDNTLTTCATERAIAQGSRRTDARRDSGSTVAGSGARSPGKEG